MCETSMEMMNTASADPGVGLGNVPDKVPSLQSAGRRWPGAEARPGARGLRLAASPFGCWQGGSVLAVAVGPPAIV